MAYTTASSADAAGLGSPSPDAPAAAGAATNTLIPLRFVYNRGTVGFASQGHHPGFGFGNNNRPANGLGGLVTLNGNPGITGAFPPILAPPRIFYGFYNTLRGAGYQCEFYKKDNQLTANELRGPQFGGTNIFNKVNIGLLVGHGVYGTTPDFTISLSGPLETYYPIYKSGVNSYDWVRFTQFKFGSSGSNLRWMGMLSCNNMIESCYDDMYNKELLPIGNNLHLLLGSSSVIFVASNFGDEYALALTGLAGVQRLSVADAWFYAGTRSQGFQTNAVKKTVTFRVAGWLNCLSDDLENYSVPNSGNPADITSINLQVFP